MDAMDAIAVEHLTKRYRDVVAVDDLSFAIPSGRITGFLGPNGAGKTTTLRALLGLVRPSAGAATFGGVPYAELPAPARTVGAVLEGASFHPARRARDHLRILATAGGLPSARVDHVLGLVDLEGAADRRVRGFSLGMRQRLGLAAALLGDPEVLVLDEPTNGLDPDGVRWLRDMLRGFAAEGRTVLVSSHLLAEVAQTVDEVVVIAGGRLVTHRRLDELAAAAAADGRGPAVRVRTPQAGELRAALAERGFAASVDPSGSVQIDGATPEEVGLTIAGAGIVVYEMQAVAHGPAQQLEDVFLELTHPEGSPR
jgi:ABC-2 type transport system ATP-binding protein